MQHNEALKKRGFKLTGGKWKKELIGDMLEPYTKYILFQQNGKMGWSVDIIKGDTIKTESAGKLRGLPVCDLIRDELGAIDLLIESKEDPKPEVPDKNPLDNLKDSGFIINNKPVNGVGKKPDNKTSSETITNQGIKDDEGLLLPLIKKYADYDVLEIFGKTGSGKTRFCLEVAKEALSLNKRVFYLDTENNLTKHQIQTELKGAVFNYTPVMEEIYETVMKLPDNTYDVVVIDSIGFPILSEFAELKMNQRGAVLLKMIALLANLKKWAYKNNGIVVVSNQPESEFNKVAGTILDPFGDKSNYAAKEIWHSDKTSSDSNRTISKITAFRSRSAGRGKKILEMTISDSGTKISV
jgi:hypothetical protein